MLLEVTLAGTLVAARFEAFQPAHSWLFGGSNRRN
jgi:hypothetical protein